MFTLSFRDGFIWSGENVFEKISSVHFFHDNANDFAVLENVEKLHHPCSQFHQHFTSSFCDDTLVPKKYTPKP